MPHYRILADATSLPIVALDAQSLRNALELAVNRSVSFAGAVLRNAHLTGANLTMADLRSADLSNTNLSHCQLAFADLRGANLSRACLDDADLHFADLRGANMTHASLQRANLTKANVLGADLCKVKLATSQLDGVIWDWRSSTVVRALLNNSKLLSSHAQSVLIALEMCNPHIAFAWSRLLLKQQSAFEITSAVLESAVTPTDNMPIFLRRMLANQMKISAMRLLI